MITTHHCRCGAWLAKIDDEGERVLRVNRKARVQRTPQAGDELTLNVFADGIVLKQPESRWEPGEGWSLVGDGRLRVVCGECGVGTNFYAD